MLLFDMLRSRLKRAEESVRDAQQTPPPVPPRLTRKQRKATPPPKRQPHRNIKQSNSDALDAEYVAVLSGGGGGVIANGKRGKNDTVLGTNDTNRTNARYVFALATGMHHGGRFKRMVDVADAVADDVLSHAGVEMDEEHEEFYNDVLKYYYALEQIVKLGRKAHVPPPFNWEAIRSTDRVADLLVFKIQDSAHTDLLFSLDFMTNIIDDKKRTKFLSHGASGITFETYLPWLEMTGVVKYFAKYSDAITEQVNHVGIAFHLEHRWNLLSTKDALRTAKTPMEFITRPIMCMPPYSMQTFGGSNARTLRKERVTTWLNFFSDDNLKLHRSRMAARDPQFNEQLCDFFISIHTIGMRHQDISQKNVLVRYDPDKPGFERLVVVDFGLAEYTTHPSIQPMDEKHLTTPSQTTAYTPRLDFMWVLPRTSYAHTNAHREQFRAHASDYVAYGYEIAEMQEQMNWGDAQRQRYEETMRKHVAMAKAKSRAR